MAKRVLVIDDSPTTVELISGALTEAGFHVRAARDLAELDERLLEAPFQLVLVDVNMPEMYGDDVVEFLRVQRKLSAKLVLYSDIAESELATKAKNSNSDGYLIKSAGLDAAVELVREMIADGPSEAPQPRLVLVVEAVARISKVLGSALIGDGGQLLTATTVGDATRILLKKKTRPDLVVIDTSSPDLNAGELCRTIKGNAIFHGIRVALVGAPGQQLTELAATTHADLAVALDEQLEHRLSTLLRSSG